MNNVKNEIQDLLLKSAQGNLSDTALKLFQALGYATDRQSPFAKKTFKSFKEAFLDGQSVFREEKALINDWKYVDLLFQLSGEEIEFGAAKQGVLLKKEVAAFGASKTVIESYLFFAIELSKDQYTRTELSQITRELNKVFPMPAMIVFKHGTRLSLSVINRRLHKRDERRDVLEKVTLIKDISTENPHRAHIEILFDLSLEELRAKYKFSDFVGLHSAWQKTLDTKELNRQFYSKLFNWYLWALKNVKFPQIRPTEDLIKDTTHQSESLIRLLTRLLFCWFMKEKGLINSELFNTEHLSEMLKDFKGKGSDETIYYKAILQNLFFATLSKPIADRKLIKNVFPNPAYGDPLVYRYAELFKKETDILKHFENIPFLNGGLFDCLDSRKDEHNPEEIRLDGFSSKKSKQPIVPDKLFFGEYPGIDLSGEYDDSKKSKVTVYGLIDILTHYKFTIEENTPIEEEVALDPELLGKVFENLLASYNPETHATARNQTGSFYTPREIVNYMVDESLKAYLKQKLTENKTMMPEDADVALGFLFEYTEKEHLFNKKQVATLIAAIDSCKVLDPACGSGAFPMGVLQKLIHILRKIDHDNKQWFEIVIGKFPASAQNAMRAKLENENWDYVRKLGIIQECIYGVDIQPIAIQISKLRFFITLLVDQNEKPGAVNRGFEALPNLDFKLVAADTLIGVPEADMAATDLFAAQTDPFFAEFDKLAEQYFSANTPEAKKELKEKITRLVTSKCDDKIKTAKKIGSYHGDDRFSKILAEKHYKGTIELKEREEKLWNSYKNLFKQEAVGFFEPKYFFPKAASGFDVVIGNPPYVQIQNFSGMQQQKDWERQKYETYSKTGDVYCLFYERGYRLLKAGGVLTFITSNKWMRANYGKVTRKFFSDNGRISQLIDFGDSPIFENATTYTNILIWNRDTQKTKAKAWDLSNVYESDTSLEHMLDQQGVCEPLFGEDSFVIVKREHTAIKKRIEEVGVPLKDWGISIYRGILTGLNEAFIVDGNKKDELIAKDPRSADIIKPILRGRDIKRYKAEFADLWLINTHNGYTDKNGHRVPPVAVKKDYPSIWEHLRKVNSATDMQVEKRSDQGDHWSNLRSCAYFDEIEKEKIFYPEIVYDSAFYFDVKAFYPEATTFIITGERLKFLTALLNSRLLTYAFKTFYAGGDLRGSTFRYKKVFLELLPVPRLSAEAQLPYEILVDCVLFCKERNLEQESGLLESVIDGLVYDLYFPEEMKNAHCYITDRISEIVKPFKRNDTIAFKNEYISKLCEFCRKDKIVYHGLIHRRTVKTVQIITGEIE